MLRSALTKLVCAAAMVVHPLAGEAQEANSALVGAWRMSTPESTTVAILAPGYWAQATYAAKDGAFRATAGGSWAVRDGRLTLLHEFHSAQPERVGQLESHRFSVTGDTLSLHGRGRRWRRIDDGSPGALMGAWLISGRKRDGKMNRRSTGRPRKTMKILSGTRFQWIAYNTETKSFMATGGGTYTTADGQYVERLEFFSRNDTRVGAVLPFGFALIDGQWHHTGQSSRGRPIHEIWGRRPAPAVLGDSPSAIGEVLDELHAAAARADEAAYFALFTSDAVFLGTDPAERWTIGAFRAYAKPHFDRGTGWAYVPSDRHISMLPGGAAAYFDEVVTSAKYGRCRGTGVVVRTADGWRVAQYSLSLPIPNAMFKSVAAAVKSGKAASSGK